MSENIATNIENTVENMIELHHIKKSYDGENTVIDDINLDIKKGEFVTLLGPSGCGKTTILRMIAGFEMPTDGEILLGGKDISELPPNERPINTVFQKYALFPHLNIYDNVAFGLKLKKMPKKQQDEKVRKALEMVDLEGFEKRSIHTLSGGQQQRISIARAIVNEPKVLLLDEPLSALDYKMRKEMQMELKNMHKKLGITFIFVTHDQEEALTMSDKVVVMAHGAIQQVGTPEEIYNEPSNVFVADFIGESNIFKGVMSGKFKAKFCKAEFTCVDDYAKGTVIDAVIRPEDFVLTKPEEGIISGEILSSDFKGTFYEVAVLCGKNEIEVHSLKNGAPGTKVGLTIDPDNIHIIPYDLSINHYEGNVDEMQEGSELAVSFAGIHTKINPARLFEGATMNDGVVYDAQGSAMDMSDVSFEAYFAPEHADLSDDAEAGIVQGNVVSFIYIDDHYSYTVRGLDEEDYIVDDEDLWNQNDFVSIIIPEDKIQYTLQ